MSKENKYPKGEEERTIMGKGTASYKATDEDMITMSFRDNRSFELLIGGVVYLFVGHTPRQIPRSILTHKDWTEEISQLFVVKE